MKRCGYHGNLIDSPLKAEQATRQLMHYAPPSLVAEFMADLGNNLCCPAVGYAHYLMSVAIRHELRERP